MEVKGTRQLASAESGRPRRLPTDVHRALHTPAYFPEIRVSRRGAEDTSIGAVGTPLSSTLPAPLGTTPPPIPGLAHLGFRTPASCCRCCFCKWSHGPFNLRGIGRPRPADMTSTGVLSRSLHLPLSMTRLSSYPSLEPFLASKVGTPPPIADAS